MQFRVGDSSKTTSRRHINPTDLGGSVSFTYLCDASPESGVHFATHRFPKMGLSHAIGGPEKVLWHDLALMKLSKSCSATRAGNIFRKNEEILQEKVCRASKAQGKEQIAHEIQKIASVMHTVVFADGAWRRKMHGSRGTGVF